METTIVKLVVETKKKQQKQFSPQQVFGILDKMNKRIKRLEHTYEPLIYDFGLRRE